MNTINMTCPLFVTNNDKTDVCQNIVFITNFSIQIMIQHLIINNKKTLDISTKCKHIKIQRYYVGREVNMNWFVAGSKKL